MLFLITRTTATTRLRRIVDAAEADALAREWNYSFAEPSATQHILEWAEFDGFPQPVGWNDGDAHCHLEVASPNNSLTL